MKNRELKFRIWDGSKMHYVDLWWNFADYLNSDMPVMQFTGLMDKEGNEIYECDVLLDTLTKAIMQVCFGHNKNHAYMGWYCKYLNVSVKDANICGDYDTDQNNMIEIIGNIFETPIYIKLI